MMYASFIKRVIAFVLDSVLTTISYILIAFFASIPLILMFVGFEDNGVEPPVLLLIPYMLLLILVVFLLMFYFYIWFPYKHRGQTLGKKLLSIKVVKDDGSELKFSEHLFRFILLYFTYTFAWITILFDENKKGIHDYVFDTVVVETK